jgi:tRNA A-37 threonylcarbamoyl transferase component Bud32
MRFHFVPSIPDRDRILIQRLFAEGSDRLPQIFPQETKTKVYFRLELSHRSLFVKSRTFSSLARRIGRTVRKTKEEAEFSNLLELQARQIPCPSPVATGREFRGPLVYKSHLLMEHLDDVQPLKLCLLREFTGRAQLLDALMLFLAKLEKAGVVHEDLQWNNLVVRSRSTGPEFYLVDALHIRTDATATQGLFGQSLAWFTHFLMRDGAPEDLIHQTVRHMKLLGVDSPSKQRQLLEKAAKMGRHHGAKQFRAI